MPYIHFEYIADVKKVVSQLGWERFTIIGHSMGANIATFYAGTFPDEVENVILLDFGGPPTASSAKTALVLAQYATRMSSAKIATPRVYQSLESAAEKRQKPFLGTTLRKEDAMLLAERGTRITKDGLIFSHDPLLKGIREPFLVPQCSLISILSRIRCAVLALEGTDTVGEVNAKVLIMERLKAIYQSTKFKICKRIKGGHHFHLENPEQVVQEIKEFLKAVCRSHNCTAQSKL